MRVDKSDLDEIVVEDGETTINPKLDVKGQGEFCPRFSRM